MSNPAAKPPRRLAMLAVMVCAGFGFVVFQWFGSAAQGYIKTPSLFWWWVSQWIDPGAETQHGWLILALSAWLLVRNLGIEKECGWRTADCGRSKRQDPPAGVARGSVAKSGEVQDPEITSAEWPTAINPPSAIRRLPSIAPFGAMLAALALHAVGFAAQQGRVSILALLLFTWGVLRLAGGRRWGGAAAFPLAFLVFAVPLNALDSVGFTLRTWVIDASAGLAHQAGIGVLQNGTQLMAADGRYNYDVAPACSGVRSLMALSALSLLIGYLNFRSWWRRGLMLLLCFPLVYLGNVARISAIIFAAHFGGSRWGDLAHEVMGYAIFVIVLGGVLAAAAWLRRCRPEICHLLGDKRARGVAEGARERRGGASASLTPNDGTESGAASANLTLDGESEPEAASPRRAQEDETGRTLTPYVAAVVGLFALGEISFLHRLATMPPRGRTGVALAGDGRDPVELPAFLGHDWVRYPAEVSPVEREILPPDTGFSRANYVASRDGQRVFISIVLSGRDRTSIHRPELCLQGQGWTIVGRETHHFSYPQHPDAAFTATILPVRHELATPRGTTSRPELVAYWFIGGDRIVATPWDRLLWDSWNRIAHARADRWAYVLLQADAADGESAALARMQAVLNGTLPVFEPLAPR